MAGEILERECGLPFKRTRFTVGTYNWPLLLVCFEGDSRWGWFDPAYYQIGLNAKLAGRVKDAVLKDLLRHELAHYLTLIHHGEGKLPHGPEYKAVCATYGWPEEVSSASGDLLAAHETLTGDLPADAVVEKVKKLLALASSTNAHEAELATLKANQLMLKHHLGRAQLEDSTPLCVEAVMRAPRRNAKMSAVYDVLTHFLVRPLMRHGRGDVRLEVIGDRGQVELAAYVAGFLERELETMWKASGLKGQRAKNSFFLGIARGYRKKLEGVIKELSSEDSHALVRVEATRDQRIHKLLGSFSGATSGRLTDPAAMAAGDRAGRGLSIHPGVKAEEGRVLSLPR